MRYNKWKLSHETALKCWYPDISKIMKFTGKSYGAIINKAWRSGLTGSYKERNFTGYKKTPTDADVTGNSQRLKPYCDLLLQM